MIGGAQLGERFARSPKFFARRECAGHSSLPTDRKSTGASVANSAPRFVRLLAASLRVPALRG